MRVSVEEGPFKVRAYAGSTGVLLALDVNEAARDGLLGFAIEERRGRRPYRWLRGKLSWEGEPPLGPTDQAESNVRPIQKFRWSDYTVEPGRTYRYRIHRATGDWRRPTLEDPVELSVKTHDKLSGGHRVTFNRAAAASQAFGTRFPTVDDDLRAAQASRQPYELPEEVLAWLSRGLQEELIAFLDKAVDDTWALDIAAYEYELDVFTQAVRAARKRGARVRIVYHAKPGDPQTHENETHLKGIPVAARRARMTSSIFHNKFVVASRRRGDAWKPVAVLAGSTNFTPNGVYRQANVVHTVTNSAATRAYADVFERLFGGATPGEMRAEITASNPVDTDGELFVGFSPRTGLADLAAFTDLVGDATTDVLFSTAFDLYDPLEDALLGRPHDDVLRLGVTNLRNNRITGYHRDRTAKFVTTALMKRGIEGFLQESYAGQRGGIHIHTKLLVVDFTGDNPTVISGSHNLSKAASASNDENYMVIRGRTDVADCYGIELLRLYEHYRARYRLNQPRAKLPYLRKTDAWTQRYWDDPMERLDRLRFAHGGPA